MEATLFPPPTHTDPAEDRASEWWGGSTSSRPPGPSLAQLPCYGGRGNLFASTSR